MSLSNAPQKCFQSGPALAKAGPENNIVVLVLHYSLKNHILPLGIIYPQFGNHWPSSWALGQVT